MCVRARAWELGDTKRAWRVPALFLRDVGNRRAKHSRVAPHSVALVALFLTGTTARTTNARMSQRVRVCAVGLGRFFANVQNKQNDPTKKK